MISRYRLILPLAAVCLALTIAPALAARTKLSGPATRIPAGTPVHEVGSISSTAQTCQSGQVFHSGHAFEYDWLYPPDDWYSNLIDPADCGCTDGLLISSAHWVLDWTTPCQIDNVVVEIDAAMEVSPSGGPGGGPCYAPDHSQVLFSTTTSLTGSGVTEHVVPLVACLTQKAFIVFKLPSTGTCPTNPDGTLNSPKYVFDDTADPCTSYNTFPGSGGPIDMLSFAFPGNTTMWVEGECALPGVCVTAVNRSTWGRVRTLYR